MKKALSKLEQQVVDLINKGKQDNSIAEELGKSTGTIKTTLYRARMKGIDLPKRNGVKFLWDKTNKNPNICWDNQDKLHKEFQEALKEKRVSLKKTSQTTLTIPKDNSKGLIGRYWGKYGKGFAVYNWGVINNKKVRLVKYYTV